MEIVNSHPLTTGEMNSCLVSRFPSHKATLSLHSDNEKIISQCSSICTVSFGAPRSSIQTNTYTPKNEIFLREQKILTAKPKISRLPSVTSRFKAFH